MTYSSHFPRRAAYVVGFLFCTLFATPTWASIIYEYRDIGSTIVIGTLEVASPPASPTTGWSTTDPSDFIALHLDDSVFGLGTANLLSVPAVVGGNILSLDGSNLDIGNILISLPPIIPANPLVDPKSDQFLSLLFGVGPESDFIGLATVNTFPNGSVTTDNLFVFGDWTVSTAVPVPEPGTATLVLMGLAAVGRAVRRRSKAQTSL